MLASVFLVRAAPTAAGTLSTPRDYLNRQQAAIASGIVHEVLFTTAGAVSGGAGNNVVIVTFPDADDGLWCRTSGTLTVTGITDPTGATESSTALPGNLTGTCAQGLGAGAADVNRDRLILLGVDNLSAAIKFGVRIAGNGADLGTAAAANEIKVTIKTNNGSADVDLGTANLALIANDRISISASVPTSPPPPTSPRVEFNGYAAPNAAITVERGGVVIATLTAPLDATYSIVLTDQPEGQQSYLIRAFDTDGKPLSPITFALNLAAGTNTVINGIFLGPSITVSPLAAVLGETVTAQGMTVPDSTVTLTVNPKALRFTATADGSGRWSKGVSSTDLGVGAHTAFAQASINDLVSLVSASASFSVGAVKPVPGGPPPVTIGPTADFNHDGRVELTDFSILLYYWHSTATAIIHTDLNQDGIVDIIDFSIMLYQWTG